MTVIPMLLHLGFAAIQTNNKTGQAIAWFNLGLTLENVNRQSERSVLIVTLVNFTKQWDLMQWFNVAKIGLSVFHNRKHQL
ncbi:hypothetical protein FJSC11DRAFT_2485 [Fischerella thermalis JSC-11]|uniref:Uncharacterized protein n=2 Tax=Fischerella TaxID=1190 RepID=G6FUD8_9CYAN|nr:hypothetical protein FJSC11DRAFT_2485 [Fischerella thermalis JSC-11]